MLIALANGNQTFINAMRKVILKNCRLNRVISFKEIKYSPKTDKTLRIRKLKTPLNLSTRVLSGSYIFNIMDKNLKR